MNKMIYVAPAIKQIRIRTISMIATSPGVDGDAGIGNGGKVTGTSADSRRNRFWDDDED